MREFDVIIAGAGIAGASLAWRLAATHRVLLLERETQPGYHSTGRSAAMFMESYGAPGVRALTRASRSFYEQPPEGFTQLPLLTPRGVLYLATHEQVAQMEALYAELAPGCPQLVRLDARTVLERVPCLRPELVHGALYDPAAEDIDVNALHQGFLRGLRQRGGTLRCAQALSAAVREGGEWIVSSQQGEQWRAPVLVNAAGAWADALAAIAGAPPVGLQPRRRSAFTFKPEEGMDVHGWPAVIGVDESWYFKPDAGLLLGSPANADPTFPHDVLPEELDIALGIHQIEAVSTLRIRRPVATWAGLRSFVEDGELVIGFDPACPGFFWLAAQGGYGIQTAAGASELAANLIAGHPIPEQLRQHGVDPVTFTPARLPRSPVKEAA
ncbi:FAD-binding oxidoreductase [Ramlibacter sp. G-1-2-2]|uniref:FAD-binding oxidoreductase n=1 Tax=Ramlibacter agri TaxID=2728837 RepID=A0A848HAT4_9BURK|nr:FAD-binding oxidoreductase [Ramlibacter agri]NML46580.1 FAD-binding oxidoreductase [Ramlibacter agri]